MEGLSPIIEGEKNENLFVKKTKELAAKHEGSSAFPLGKIVRIGYSDLGRTLLIELSGDVPTNFQTAHVVIVHPDSEREGWIGKGNIGFTLGGGGVPISKIPLPAETINLIKTIYREYTGEESREYTNRETIEGSNDATPFAVPGLYNQIVQKEEKK